MLTDENQRVGEPVKRDGQPSAGRAHHEFVFFEFLAVIVEDTSDIGLMDRHLGSQS